MTRFTRNHCHIRQFLYLAALAFIIWATPRVCAAQNEDNGACDVSDWIVPARAALTVAASTRPAGNDDFSDPRTTYLSRADTLINDGRDILIKLHCKGHDFANFAILSSQKEMLRGEIKASHGANQCARTRFAAWRDTLAGAYDMLSVWSDDVSPNDEDLQNTSRIARKQAAQLGMKLPPFGTPKNAVWEYTQRYDRANDVAEAVAPPGC
jgi:hypothetical protein